MEITESPPHAQIDMLKGISWVEIAPYMENIHHLEKALFELYSMFYNV